MSDQIEQLEFTVQGIPIPQGSKTAYVKGKRAVIVDANKELLKPWRAHVCHEAAKALAGRTGSRMPSMCCSTSTCPDRKRCSANDHQ